MKIEINIIGNCSKITATLDQECSNERTAALDWLTSVLDVANIVDDEEPEEE